MGSLDRILENSWQVKNVYNLDMGDLFFYRIYVLIGILLNNINLRYRVYIQKKWLKFFIANSLYEREQLVVDFKRRIVFVMVDYRFVDGYCVLLFLKFFYLCLDEGIVLCFLDLEGEVFDI